MHQSLSSTVRSLATICIVALAALVSATAHSATRDYANLAGANDWAADASWLDGIAPGVSDIATINGVDGITNYAYLDSTRSIQRFTLATNNGHMGGLELRSGANLGAIANDVSYIGARGPAFLRILDGATLSTSNVLHVGWGSTSGHGTGEVVQSGGSYTGNSGSGGITMGLLAADANFPASSGTYTLNSGSVSLGGTLIVGHAGTGIFNMNGGSVTTGNFLQIGRTGNGKFIQKAGPLIVNRSSLEAMVVGAVTGAVGLYEISGGSLTVNTTGAAGVAIGVPTGDAFGTFKVVGNGATGITINGDYKQYANSNLTLEIGAGTGITPVAMTGSAALGGNLNVSFTSTPTVGHQYTIMTYGGAQTGTFTFDDLVDGPGGPNTIPLSISYGSGTADSVILTVLQPTTFPPGDYDHNGFVQTADYNLWRQTFGNTGASATDGNGNLTVDAADYVIWRRNYSGSGAGFAASPTVPEPGALVLYGFLALTSLRRNRK